MVNFAVNIQHKFPKVNSFVKKVFNKIEDYKFTSRKVLGEILSLLVDYQHISL